VKRRRHQLALSDSEDDDDGVDNRIVRPTEVSDGGSVNKGWRNMKKQKNFMFRWPSWISVTMETMKNAKYGHRLKAKAITFTMMYDKYTYKHYFKLNFDDRKTL
jgi:hypothetical protein